MLLQGYIILMDETSNAYIFHFQIIDQTATGHRKSMLDNVIEVYKPCIYTTYSVLLILFL